MAASFGALYCLAKVFSRMATEGGKAAAGPAAVPRPLLQYDPSAARTGWRYLDHTADIVLHGWGDTYAECFAAVAHAMVGYMTDIAEVRMAEQVTFEVEGTSDDTLMFNFLHELLYLFGTQRFVPARVTIAVLQRGPTAITAAAPAVGGDDATTRPSHLLRATAVGERWEEGRHHQGTEVKAVTKHGMAIGFEEEDMRCHAKVVVDI